MRTTIVFLCFIFVLFGCQSRKEKILGSWHQLGILPTIEGFNKADSLFFGDTSFEWHYTVFQDIEKQHRIFTLRTNGTWVCEGRNEKDPEITNIKLLVKAKYITLFDSLPKAMDNYYLRICYLPLNTEVDISTTGCAVMAPIKEQPTIYQCCMVNEGKLSIGKYNLHELPDAPEKRPTDIEKLVFVKIDSKKQ